MKTVISGSFAASFLIAFVPLYVGIQHNAMGEFCKNDSLAPCSFDSFDYFYALGIWTSWFVIIFISLIGISVVIRLCIAGYKGHRMR